MTCILLETHARHRQVVNALVGEVTLQSWLTGGPRARPEGSSQSQRNTHSNGRYSHAGHEVAPRSRRARDDGGGWSALEAGLRQA